MTDAPTLAERRRALGLSRVKLAALLGIEQTTVWRYETRPAPPPWYLLAIEALEHRSLTATLRKP